MLDSAITYLLSCVCVPLFPQIILDGTGILNTMSRFVPCVFWGHPEARAMFFSVDTTAFSFEVSGHFTFGLHFWSLLWLLLSTYYASQDILYYLNNTTYYI